jgi:hypothetical protein
MNIRGEILEDIFAHYNWVYKKCLNFQGREDIIEEALSYIYNTNRDNNDNNYFNGITLALIASSGLGKTSIMAKLVSIISNNEQKEDTKRPIIVRFCGINKGSVNGYNLIKSITIQILYIYNNYSNNNDDDDKFPKLYNDAVDIFQKCLSEYPVVLVIDSIDQLDDSNAARSQLSFLRGIKPHPMTRIIISSLPDDKKGVCYWTERRLLDNDVPIIYLKPFNYYKTEKM